MKQLGYKGISIITTFFSSKNSTAYDVLKYSDIKSITCSSLFQAVSLHALALTETAYFEQLGEKPHAS